MTDVEGAKPLSIAIKSGVFNSELVWGRKGDHIEPSKRMTQRQLAEAAGVAAHRLCLFETVRAWPTPEEAEKLTKVLGKSSEDLFPEELRFFITSKNQPAQVRVRLTKREVDKIMRELPQKTPNVDYVVGFASILDKPQTLIENAQEALRIGDLGGALDIANIAANRIVFSYTSQGYREKLYRAAADPNNELDNLKVRQLRLVHKIREAVINSQARLEQAEDHLPGGP